MKKDVIYIDVEDDITAIIDRIKSSSAAILALVLPKRAQVLHSSVNMRLLKRSAGDADKRLVLVTTESAVLRLAGNVGLHVAKSLTSKPVLVKAESNTDDKPAEIKLDEADEPTEDQASSTAAKPDQPAETASDDLDNAETIELDDADDQATAGETIETDEPKTPKDKKLKVPNFDRFRLKLFLFGFGAIAVIVLLFMALYVWPKATITIKARTSGIDSKFDFTAKIDQKALDAAGKIVPATTQELKQSLTEKATPTGKKDMGTKAGGTMTVYNCNKQDQAVTVPAGTGFSNNGFVFRTAADVTISASNFKGDGTCKKDISKDVTVTADQGGDSYNLSARAYGSDLADISGYGSAMTGGVSKIVTVVSADDVEAAKQRILARATDQQKAALTDQSAKASLLPLAATFTVVPSDATSVPKVDEEASADAVVTLPVTYQMLAVKQSDLETLVAADQKPQYKPADQKIYDNGVKTAKIAVSSKVSATDTKLTYSGTAVVGPIIDTTAIAKQIAGKNGGDTKQIILSRPDIDSVDVQYSPLWVLKTPTKISKITINFKINDKVQ